MSLPVRTRQIRLVHGDQESRSWWKWVAVCALHWCGRLGHPWMGTAKADTCSGGRRSGPDAVAAPGSVTVGYEWDGRAPPDGLDRTGTTQCHSRAGAVGALERGGCDCRHGPSESTGSIRSFRAGPGSSTYRSPVCRSPMRGRRRSGAGAENLPGGAGGVAHSAPAGTHVSVDL